MPHPLLELVRSLLPLRDAAGRELLALTEATPDADDGGLTVGLRATIYEESSMSGMCEQLTTLVPAGHAEHPALAAYLRASFAAVPRVLAGSICPAPVDLFFPELLALPGVVDEAGFTALLADAERLAALLTGRDDSERREAYLAAVGPAHVDRLLALRRARHLLISGRVEPDELDELSPAGCQLGGHPGLPAGFAWPHIGDQPLTFLAQIDLAELAPLCAPDTDLLPETGVLSLFLALTGGEDPAHGPGRLLYFPDPDALVRTSPPAGRDDLALPTFEVTPEFERATLPGWEQPHLALALDTFDDDHDDNHRGRPYERAADQVRHLLMYEGTEWPEGNPRHQLLGWPAVLQSDPLAAAAYDEREHLGAPHPPWDSRESAEQAAQWRLLLQIDSEDDDFMLGDAGMVHVLIREPDLRARRFERARIVWQMH